MQSGIEILIVDDNPVNLKLAGDLLEIEGFKVYKYADAESALHALNEIYPALILMDMALPGMDGLQLTQILKAQENTRYIPIIALTASAMKGDMDKMLAAGCDGYISKPIDTRKFVEQLSQYLK